MIIEPGLGPQCTGRARVEIEYLIFLTKARAISFIPKLDAQATAELRGLYRAFSQETSDESPRYARLVVMAS